MKSVEEFLAHTIQLESEAALRFGQLADAMVTAGNKEVGRLFRRLADYSLLHLGDAKARAGSLHGFTGISGDYQPPTASELAIDTSVRSVPDATDDIERMLVGSGILFEEPVDLAANI